MSHREQIIIGIDPDTDRNGNTYTALLIDGIPVHRITADNITESEVQLTAVRKEYYNKRANAI